MIQKNFVVLVKCSLNVRLLCKFSLYFFSRLQCRELYTAMKEAMERAAVRGKVILSGRDLGGEFPVQDMESNQGGLLQVRIDGITLLFEERQVMLPLTSLFLFQSFGIFSKLWLYSNFSAFR